MTRIDLNADAGEGVVPGIDEALMPLLSSVNIACGGHAGDEESMLTVCRLGVQHGVRVGAHPSYPDRSGFGRTSISMPFEDLVESLRSQIDSLKAAAAKAGTKVAYVKPHGALYNDSAADPADCAGGDLGGRLPAGDAAGRRPGGRHPGGLHRPHLPARRTPDAPRPAGFVDHRPRGGRRGTSAGACPERRLFVRPLRHTGRPGTAAAARRALEEAGYTIGP